MCQAPSKSTTCTLPSCDQRVVAKGLCGKHYRRQLRASKKARIDEMYEDWGRDAEERVLSKGPPDELAESSFYPAFVYAIAEKRKDGNVKIGVARDPNQRLRDMQVGNSSDLMLIDVRGPMPRKDALAVESELHGQLNEYRVRGEWFSSRAIEKLI